jgi:RAB protein geranylgeranyltransferase component A
VPKFMMANGELMKVLFYTDVTRYLEFLHINGSYVYRDGRSRQRGGVSAESARSRRRRPRR